MNMLRSLTMMVVGMTLMGAVWVSATASAATALRAEPAVRRRINRCRYRRITVEARLRDRWAVAAHRADFPDKGGIRIMAKKVFGKILAGCLMIAFAFSSGAAAAEEAIARTKRTDQEKVVDLRLDGNEADWTYVGEPKWKVDPQGRIFPPAWPKAEITYVGSYSYDLARTDYAFFTGTALADVEFSVEFKIYYSTAPYGGVVFRAVDSARCYLVEVRAITRRVQEYTVVLWQQDEAGFWRELACASAPLPKIDYPSPSNPEEWFKSSPDWAKLQVRATGSHIEVALDGKTLVAVEDDAYPAGCVGLFAHGPVLFRNLRVRGTEGELSRPWAMHEGALPRFFYPGKDGTQPRGFNAFPAVAVRGETVYVAWSHGAISLVPATTLLTRSDDGGRTWTAPEPIARPELIGTGKSADPLPSFVYSLLVHDDGRLSCGYGVCGYRGARKVEAGFFISTDRGATWSGPVAFRPGGKEISHWGGWALQPYSPISRLSDGTLVMTWWKRSGTIDDPRGAVLFRSTDDGQTWSAPIYFDKENVDTNEAMVAETAPGKLVVFIRPAEALCMWTGTSDDGGLTWTKLVPSNLTGYSPIMLAHSSRVVVLASRDGGRDSINLSFDQGRSWTRRYRISPAGGMLNMVELADATILMVMCEGYREGQYIRAQRFRVTERGSIPAP